MSLRTASLPETLKREAAKLSPEARLLLADALWDDIEAELAIAPPDLPPEHRAILEVRNAELEASPDGPRKSLDEILGKHGSCSVFAERLFGLEGRLAEVPLMCPVMARSIRGAWLHPFRYIVYYRAMDDEVISDRLQTNPDQQ